MELMLIKGKLYWFTDFSGENIDGIAFGVFDRDIAMKREDVFYIFEGKKEEFINSFDQNEIDIVKFFFESFAYSMESCDEFFFVKKVA